MTLRWPTNDETNAALRHVYTAVGTATAVLVLVGMSQGDATTIGNAIHQIGSGVALIVAGVGALIPVVSGIFAALSASPLAALLRMQKNPDIKQVVAIPGTPTAKLTEQIPGDKVTTK